MASKKVEDYAHRYGISNKEAKRRLGKSARTSDAIKINIQRGSPIPGTGKPPGA